jgi:hypothetical protein
MLIKFLITVRLSIMFIKKPVLQFKINSFFTGGLLLYSGRKNVINIINKY